MRVRLRLTRWPSTLAVGILRIVSPDVRLTTEPANPTSFDGLRRVLLPDLRIGNSQRKIQKANTEKTIWAEAKAIIAASESAGSWTVPVPVQPLADPAPLTAENSRITIDDAINAFLAIREGSGISASTLRKHKNFAKQIRGLADSRGYVMLDQLTARGACGRRAMQSVCCERYSGFA